MFSGGDWVIAIDYDVPGLATESCHYFWNSFLLLHGMSLLRSQLIGMVCLAFWIRVVNWFKRPGGPIRSSMLGCW